MGPSAASSQRGGPQTVPHTLARRRRARVFRQLGFCKRRGWHEGARLWAHSAADWRVWLAASDTAGIAATHACTTHQAGLQRAEMRGSGKRSVSRPAESVCWCRAGLFKDPRAWAGHIARSSVAPPSRNHPSVAAPWSTLAAHLGTTPALHHLHSPRALIRGTARHHPPVPHAPVLCRFHAPAHSVTTSSSSSLSSSAAASIPSKSGRERMASHPNSASTYCLHQSINQHRHAQCICRGSTALAFPSLSCL
ncbi:hypothetical protein P154DRAFT_588426 [Amniculicola lignicola CBS 123094]|uniref:Uncharacterized protein n=1 Tax=Amniculicola lignicola CBS 123094 TaxID=1392246 RepID=A0A6A5VWB0_9PLEO|nr:hypothetical protein P154DRAFT_588426 [Amniculicola lignicola CBS 123094]